MPIDRPLLEVLPLNTEQLQAMAQGRGTALTVVTGPPGAGKSQLALAWLGIDAIFDDFRADPRFRRLLELIGLGGRGKVGSLTQPAPAEPSMLSAML